ncbi:MAG: hypothetical protein ACPG7F_16240 [Aggregatilineales bacterium]
MPQPARKGLFGDAKHDYDEVAQQRQETLEELDPRVFAESIRPTAQNFGPPIIQRPIEQTIAELSQQADEEDDVPPNEDTIAALLLRTEALLNQALKVPPDEDGTLREYPDKILALEKRLMLATGASEVLQVSIAIREMEVAFKWDVLENVTRITERQQRAKDFRTMRLIPAIIFLYSILMVIILLQSDADYTLPLFQIPLSVLGAGLVGGVTAQYYRYRTVTPSRLTDNDIVWFFTKPLIALLMAGLAYGMIQAGFFVFQEGTTASNLTLWPIWIIAALVGFSDWFFDKFIVQAVGRITGTEDEAVVTELKEVQMLSEQELQALQLRQLTTGAQQDVVRRLFSGNARTVVVSDALLPDENGVTPDPALTPEIDDSVPNTVDVVLPVHNETSAVIPPDDSAMLNGDRNNTVDSSTVAG